MLAEIAVVWFFANVLIYKFFWAMEENTRAGRSVKRFLARLRGE